ncbi:MAG: AMP-binding protein, partial [candidate division Zixibacteria bacterium]
MAGIRTINKSLIEVLRGSRDRFGDVPCMKRYDGEKFVDISYNDFTDQVFRIAKGLLALGFQKDDKVALLSENRPEWGASYLGVLAGGCVDVPLDALLKIAGWSHILRDSQARALIVSKNLLPEFEQIFDDLPDLEYLICMDKPSPGSQAISLGELEEKGAGYEGKLPEPQTSDLAAILYTSGTTGQAKGVMLTHGNITSDMDGVLQIIDAGPDDTFLSVLPIHHTFECTCGFLTPLAAGCSIAYARGLASKLIVEDIKSNNATILLGVPLLYEKMFAGMMKAISKKPPLTRLIFKTTYGISKIMLDLFKTEAGKKIFKGLREKAGLATLRLMVAGGAPMPPEIAKGFNLLGFTFIQGYGLTETSPVLTINPIATRRDASIGMVVPGAEIKIVDTDNRGIGHIIARGPMVMKGYYRNQEATDEIIKDGWIYTGDSGWVDDEGFYYIAGRLKNVIVTPAGKNVYPEEIEAVLNLSPYILESIVMARPQRGTRGEEIQAVVVPDFEYFDAFAAERDQKFTEKEIEATIKREVNERCSTLADFKKVKYIQIREE